MRKFLIEAFPPREPLNFSISPPSILSDIEQEGSAIMTP